MFRAGYRTAGGTVHSRSRPRLAGSYVCDKPLRRHSTALLNHAAADTSDRPGRSCASPDAHTDVASRTSLAPIVVSGRVHGPSIVPRVTRIAPPAGRRAAADNRGLCGEALLKSPCCAGARGIRPPLPRAAGERSLASARAVAVFSVLRTGSLAAPAAHRRFPKIDVV